MEALLFLLVSQLALRAKSTDWLHRSLLDTRSLLTSCRAACLRVMRTACGSYLRFEALRATYLLFAARTQHMTMFPTSSEIGAEREQSEAIFLKP